MKMSLADKTGFALMKSLAALVHESEALPPDEAGNFVA